MLVWFKNNCFVIGQFEKVINFLSKETKNTKNSQIILPCSLHDFAIQKNDTNTRSFYKNVDYCTSDSMLITNYLRRKYQKKIDRVYGPNLMLAILDKQNKSKSKIKHYLLGPSKETIIKIESLFKKNYPNIKFAFEHLPKNISKKNENICLKKIIDQKPQVVWIGIGSPKQLEIASWLKINSIGTKIFCVGAAFDFISGQKKQAPLWMQKHSLEWLFRLINEPQRLWRRYLITIPKYLILSIFDKE